MREKNRSCKQEKNPFVYYSFCFFDVIFDSSFFLVADTRILPEKMIAGNRL